MTKLVPSHYPLMRFSCNEEIRNFDGLNKKIIVLNIFSQLIPLSEEKLEYTVSFSLQQIERVNIYNYVNIVKKHLFDLSKFVFKYKMFSINNVIYKIEDFDDETKTATGSIINPDNMLLLPENLHTITFDLIEGYMNGYEIKLYPKNQIVVIGRYVYLDGEILFMFSNDDKFNHFLEDPINIIANELALIYTYGNTLTKGDYTVYCEEIDSECNNLGVISLPLS